MHILVGEGPAELVAAVVVDSTSLLAAVDIHHRRQALLIRHTNITREDRSPHSR